MARNETPVGITTNAAGTQITTVPDWTGKLKANGPVYDPTNIVVAYPTQLMVYDAGGDLHGQVKDPSNGSCVGMGEFDRDVWQLPSHPAYSGAPAPAPTAAPAYANDSQGLHYIPQWNRKALAQTDIDYFQSQFPDFGPFHTCKPLKAGLDYLIAPPQVLHTATVVQGVTTPIPVSGTGKACGGSEYGCLHPQQALSSATSVASPTAPVRAPKTSVSATSSHHRDCPGPLRCFRPHRVLTSASYVQSPTAPAPAPTESEPAASDTEPAPYYRPNIEPSAEELNTPSAAVTFHGNSPATTPAVSAPVLPSTYSAPGAGVASAIASLAQQIPKTQVTSEPVTQPAPSYIAPPPESYRPVITVAGSTYTADSSSRFVVSDQTISADGSTATVDNTPVAYLPGGSSAVIAGSTVSVASAQVHGTPTASGAAYVAPTSPTSAAVLTVGGSTYVADQSSNFAIGSQTLVPDGSTRLVDSTPVSVLPGGISAVVGGNTVSMASTEVQDAQYPTTAPFLASIQLSSAAVITVAGQTYTADSRSNFIVHGQTVSADGSTQLVDNTPIAVLPGGSSAVIDGSTISLAATQVQVTHVPNVGLAQSSKQPVPTDDSPYASAAGIIASVAAAGSTPVNALPSVTTSNIVFAGATFTPVSDRYVVAGQTLEQGGSVTMQDGLRTETAILSTDAIGHTVLAIGGSSTKLPPAGAAFTSAPSEAVFTVSGHIYTAVHTSIGGIAVIGRTTISAGGPAATFGNQIVSAASNGIAFNDGTITYSALDAPVSEAATFGAGDHLYTATGIKGGNAAVFDGTTVSAGGPAETIRGQVVSAVSGGIVVDGQTVAYTAATNQNTPAAVYTANGQTHSALEVDNGSAALVDGTNLSVGGPAETFHGQAMSAVPNGVVVNGQTITYSAAIGPMTEAAVFTAGGEVQTAVQRSGNNGALVDGTTLYVGGSARLISGQTVSAASDGILVNGQTITYSAPNEQITEAALYTAGSAVHTAIDLSSGRAALVDGTTLSPGGPAQIINGQTISALSNGIVVNGHTVSYSATVGLMSAAGALTAAGFTFTPLASSNAVLIDGQTLKLGSSITLGSGASTTLVALETNSLGQPEIVEDHSTILLSSSGLGSYIMNGLRPQQTSTGAVSTTGGRGSPIIVAATSTASATQQTDSSASAALPANCLTRTLFAAALSCVLMLLPI